MGYSVPAKNLMLNALAAVALRASLHTGDPGADGSQNELSGGSPAYARKAVAWNAAAAGNLDMDGTAVFDVPAGVTVSHVGFWNIEGTAYYGSGQISPEEFTNQGTYTLSDADLDLNLDV